MQSFYLVFHGGFGGYQNNGYVTELQLRFNLFAKLVTVFVRHQYIAQY